ncbi:hypothetical protein FEC14_18820, partial [Acinetobacter baumannii]
DLILEMVSFNSFNLIVFILFYLSTGLTVFYTFRLIIYVIINDFNLIIIYNLYDEDYIMLNRIFVLLFIRLLSGSFLS